MAKGVEDCAFYRWSPADLAQRGRRRPVGLRHRPGAVPRLGGAPAARVAARDDLPVHARHQARRGRPRPDHGAGRAARPVGVRPRPAARAGPAARPRLREPALAGDRGLLARGRCRRLAPGDLRERLHGYAEKAMREAGDRTTWTEPDEAYESAVHAAVDAAVDDPAVTAVVTDLVARLAGPGWSNALAAKLLSLTAARRAGRLPGQRAVGAEPGRPRQPPAGRLRAPRRAARRRRRRAITLTDRPDDPGTAKLAVTHAALRLRRERPDLFTGVRRAGRRGRRPPTTRSPSTGVARSPSSPGCRSASRPAAAGATPRSGCRPARGSSRSPAAATSGRVPLADLLADLPGGTAGGGRPMTRGPFDVWAPVPGAGAPRRRR